MGKQWKQCQTLFFWAPKSLQMVTAAMKLRDAYSLEGKLPQHPNFKRVAEVSLELERKLQVGKTRASAGEERGVMEVASQDPLSGRRARQGVALAWGQWDSGR